MSLLYLIRKSSIVKKYLQVPGSLLLSKLAVNAKVYIMVTDINSGK